MKIRMIYCEHCAQWFAQAITSKYEALPDCPICDGEMTENRNVT